MLQLWQPYAFPLLSQKETHELFAKLSHRRGYANTQYVVLFEIKNVNY